MSNVRDFGAAGDGRRDDTEAIQHALKDGDGVLEFPRGEYLISQTISIELSRTGRVGIVGSAGTAKILMASAGPAFHLLGTHDKSAAPDGFQPEVWHGQRQPTVLNIEIEGRDPAADGFLLEGVMQATFEGVLLRELRHGIHVHRRARNLLISHCHIYHNTGVGIFLEQVNLHQAIIAGSHVSYCRQGGIKIIGSEIRNLQITGNDIEYNFDAQAAASADIWIDSSADQATVREGTIVGNTIQASYSPGGANVRIVGHNRQTNHKAGMFTISDNLIGSQEINVHLVACRGVVVSGNVIYSGHRRNLQLDGCRNIVVGPNSFDHNPDYRDKELCTGVRFADSRDCTLSGSIIHDCQAGEHTVKNAQPIERDGLLEVVRCQRVSISGCQILDGYPACVFVEDSQLVSLTGCTVLDTREVKKTQSLVQWKGEGRGNYLAVNTFGKTIGKPLDMAAAAGVKMGENLLDAD